MLYKVRLKQKTENIGTIKASTLFGAFVTAYSNYASIDDDIIDDIVLSDLFIKGQLPVGIENNNTLYNKVSRNTKVMNVTRTLITRDTNSANVVNVRQAELNNECEFYISTELLDKSDLEKVINTMLILGIGTWRNIGKGQFSLISIDEYVPETDKTRFVALSNFIPTDADIKDIVSTGYEIRNAVASNGLRQSTTTLLKTGTTFKSHKEIVGKHVYDEASKTYIHGKAIVLGV